MNEDFNDYLQGNQKLNSTILRGEHSILPIEILSIRYIEQSTEGRSRTFTPYMHQHTYFEMHVPIAGTQIYRLDDEEISVGPNEMILFSPNTLHSIPYSGADLRKVSMGFTLLDRADEGEFGWVSRELYSRSVLKTEADEWFVTLFRRVFKEARKAQVGWTTLVMDLIAHLVIDIARENLPQAKPEGVARSLQRKRIESIERFIMDNISAPINNQMLAQHMYLSIRQLDRITLAERKMTLKALIDEIKLREARRLLHETRMGQKEIASTLGFTEVSSFNRFFHRFEAVSPGVYRKQRAMENKKNEDENVERE